MPFTVINNQINSMQKGTRKTYQNMTKDSDGAYVAVKNFLERLVYEGVVKIVETNSVTTTIERL